MRSLFLAAIGLACCGAAPACRPALEAQLYFGLVDEAGFTAFLNQEVTPRFPAGLTVVDAAGRWRDPAGRLTQEPARMVIIVAPPSDTTLGRLQAIRKVYKARFSQQSVGMVLQRVCADF